MHGPSFAYVWLNERLSFEVGLPLFICGRLLFIGGRLLFIRRCVSDDDVFVLPRGPAFDVGSLLCIGGRCVCEIDHDLFVFTLDTAYRCAC